MGGADRRRGVDRAGLRPCIRSSGPDRRPPAAEQVLAERFARGEIDEDEYRRRAAVLRGDVPHTGGPSP
ncbi:SHOCT domain-containing protein [Streptomyces griseoincarnatus]